MGWKEVPGLFWLDKKRGALCVSFRKDCGAEIWRKSAIESGRGQDFLPTGTAYGPLSVSVYALGGIVHVTQYSHSWVILGKWWHSHTPSKYKVTKASETILCQNKIKSVIPTHAYTSSKRVLGLWISRLSICQSYYPRSGTNFWFKVLRFAIMEKNLDLGIYTPFHSPASSGVCSCSHFSLLLSPRISWQLK